MNATLPSSAVIAFPSPAPQPGVKFAEASKAWLNRWHEDARLTHADRTLVTRIYIGFNQRHFERTGGELIAWPGWETIEAGGRLSQSSIDRGLKKLERLGALVIIKRGHNPKTGWRLSSTYRVAAQDEKWPRLRMKEDSVSPDSVRVSKKVSKSRVGGKQTSGRPRGQEAPKEEKQATPSVDPLPLFQTTALEASRATPRNGRAWQFTAPDKVAAAEAT